MKATIPPRRFSVNPQLILPGISAGLVIGILVVFVEVSFAALIFSGELDIFLSQGIGILLFGALILGVVISLTSAIPSAIAIPQDAPAVILAIVAAGIAGAMTAAKPEQLLATVVAAMMLSGILTGIFFWFLGRFNLGKLVRFIPYPVVGGFLAGTGWLLIVGAYDVMSNSPFDWSFLQPDALIRWLPGLLFGIILYFVLRRFSHFLLMPALIIAGIGSFYLILYLSGGSLETAVQDGWLLGPFPDGSLWQPMTALVLTEADWGVVAAQAVTLSTVFLVAAISLLMNATGLEITTKIDVDLNRKLITAGIGNMLAGLGGSFPGYQSVSLSTLGFKLGASTRIVGLVSAAVVALVLILGAGLIAFFPRLIAGGFLFFIGLGFLVEWLYDAYFKLSKLEYLLIWLILIVIAAFGFLEGVTVGTIVASIFFVINYSRIKVARHSFTGADYQSHVMRPPYYQELLHKLGNCIQIMELQGYVFFGTAYNFLEQIKNRIEDPEQDKMRFLLLDFRLVTGIDSSAILSMKRLMQLANMHNIDIVLTSLTTEGQLRWAKEIDIEDNLDQVHMFPDFNTGIAWCEQALIDSARGDRPPVKPKPLVQRLDEILQHNLNGAAPAMGADQSLPQQEETAVRLAKFISHIDVDQDQCLLREGSTVDGLYFVEKGQVIAKTTNIDGQEIELRTMETGTVFGEIGVYSHLTATADVTAAQPSKLLYLSAKKLHLMESEDPLLALAFHRLIAGIMAEKLAQSSQTARALLS